MRFLQEIAYKKDATSQQMLDLYLPDTNNFPTFVHFHGGGLESGDKKGMHSTGEYLAAHGIAFVTANYRLYPDAVYPEFIRDAAAAVAWTKKHIAEYGDNDRIYVGGDSAGAYLSMMLCFDSRWLTNRRRIKRRIPTYNKKTNRFLSLGIGSFFFFNSYTTST